MPVGGTATGPQMLPPEFGCRALAAMGWLGLDYVSWSYSQTRGPAPPNRRPSRHSKGACLGTFNALMPVGDTTAGSMMLTPELSIVKLNPNAR